jgi:hypothetical protein
LPSAAAEIILKEKKEKLENSGSCAICKGICVTARFCFAFCVHFYFISFAAATAPDWRAVTLSKFVFPDKLKFLQQL